MDSQLKVIVLNDLNILKDKRYLLFNVFVVLFLFVFKYKIVNDMSVDLNYLSYFSQFIFMFIAGFVMLFLGIQILQEFSTQKANRIYEVVLTSPISLLKLYYSKLISSFVLVYPAVICAILIYVILLNGTGSFDIPIEVMIMALLIIPLYMLLYYAFGLYLILRFKNMNVIQILSLTGTGLVFLGVYGSKYLSIHIILSGEHLVSYLFLVYASIGLIIGFLIVFTAIKKFNKEKLAI
ncbi:MAG: ABC transporter permease [Methanobrevibacter sp.]|jgi:hypothetical protein|nr:ABC transporter permease [Candidatus Methanovirga aequatorialis]